jgi:UDP-2-acetamido-3-amino-2,3-dideoxy-glucuronate N-acetyltransferase
VLALKNSGRSLGVGVSDSLVLEGRPVHTSVAVVGAGYWGKNLVRNFHELGALRAICDTSEDVARRCAKEFPEVPFFRRYEDLLHEERLDAVVLAVPAPDHYRAAMMAFDAGKDVFVEKPMALHLEEGFRLHQRAEHERRILMVGHVLLFHPAVVKLKDLVRQGTLGQLQYLYSNRLNLGRFRKEENILWSFAPHDISVMMHLLEEKPVQVVAHGNSYLHPSIADATVSYLEFPSGVHGHIFVSWLHPIKEHKLVVVGSKGMAIFSDTSDAKLMYYPHRIDWIDRSPVPVKAEGEPIPLEAVEPLRLECAHFLRCLETRERPLPDSLEGLTVLEVLDACQQSLNRGVAFSLAKPQVSPGPSAYSVHPSSIVDPGAEVGEGSHIWHFSHIMRGARIGRRCIIGQNVFIGSDVSIGEGVKIQNNVSVYKGVTIEDYVFCGPSMVFTNVINPRGEIERKEEFRPTLVKRGATLGANCTVLCGHTIGRYAMVGAGAVVTHDVPDYALMVGSPARRVDWVCRCGNRLTPAEADSWRCSSCPLRYREKNGMRLLE